MHNAIEGGALSSNFESKGTPNYDVIDLIKQSFILIEQSLIHQLIC